MTEIIDIDTQIIGFPCYKPIIRSLGSTAEVPEFERFVFGISRMEKIKDEEAINTLEHLMQSCVTDSCKAFGVNLYTVDTKTVEKKDLPSFILSRNQIKTHKLCTSYYQKYQPSLNACLACKRSVLYCNRFLKEELSILKYMLKEKENCDYIEEKVKEHDITFLGVFDILYDFFCKRTIYMPLNRLLFTYISNNDSTIFFESMRNNPDDRTNLFSSNFVNDFTKMKDIPTEFVKKYGLQKAIIQRQLDRIEKSSDLTKTDVDELLRTISEYQKSRSDRIAAFEGLPLSQKSTFISYAIKPGAPSGYRPEPKKEPVAATQTYLDLSIEIYSGALEEMKKDSMPPAEEPSDTTDATDQKETNTPVIEQKTTEEPEESTSDTGQSFALCLYKSEKQLPQAVPSVFQSKKEDLPPYREINTPSYSSIPMEFTSQNAELSFFRSINGSLIILGEMEDAALRDGCIAIEAVHTNDGIKLLLFTSTRHLFLSTDLQNKTEKRVIGQILKQNGLKKVCYLPYLLYAFCYEKGLAINGVHSLLTYHAFFNPKSPLLGLKDLLLENIEVNRDYVRKTLENSDTLLFDSMRHYKKVFRIQKKETPKSHTLSSMEAFDKAIGYSYLLSGCMDCDARLFVRSSLTQFEFFNNEYAKHKSDVRFSGYFATYEFDIHTKHAVEITTQFLCSLTKKNIIGEYNIQLVSLQKNRTVFFISKDEFDYLDAVITTLIRDVASQYGHPLLKIFVIYEYYSAKTKEEPPTQK